MIAPQHSLQIDRAQVAQQLQQKEQRIAAAVEKAQQKKEKVYQRG